MIRVRALLHGLASLAALVALIGGAPLALLRLGRLPDPSNGDWWSRVTESAMSDTAVFAVLTVAAWAAWTIFATAVIVETVAGLRGMRAPRIALAGPFQHAARSLVVPILLLVSLAQNAPPVAAHTPGSPLPSRSDATTVVVELPPSTLRTDAGPTSPQPTPTETPSAAAPTDGAPGVVVVERNDNPWRLAEAHLGDGLRWRELFEVNRGVPQLDGRAWTNPEVILPGWHLRLPVEASGPTPIETGTIVHEVERGDTLSGLAARYLGDANRYPELFDANQHIVQPDGRHLTDPDLIVVGWRISVPAAEPTAPPPPAPEAEPETPTGAPDDTSPTVPTETPPVSPPVEQPTAPAPTTPAPTTPAPRPSADVTAPPRPDPRPATPSTTEVDEPSPLPVVAGLVSALALATGLALRVRWLRRRRATRDPLQRDLPQTTLERAVAAAADEPLVRWAGQCLAAAQHALDRRSVTAAPIAVELSESSGIELLWDAPQHATPPAGWTAADGGWAWRHPYDPDAPVPTDELPAAIPALVTIGHREGRQLLVDLEAFGSLTIDGPTTHSRALAAAIAVELACGNDLADAYVTTVGIDLDSGIAPRHRLTVADPAAALSMLESARRSIDDVLAHDGSPDTFHARLGDRPPLEATIAIAHGLAPDDLDALAAANEPRRGTAVVASGVPRLTDRPHVEIEPSGAAARLEPLGITFQPAGLGDDTITDIAATISALTDLPADQPPVRTVLPSSNGERAARGSAAAPVESAAASNGHRNDTEIHVEPGATTTAQPDGDGGVTGPTRLEPGRLFDLTTSGGDEAPMIVRVLGVPRIEARPLMRRRELILATLLASRGGNLAASAAQDALWGGKPIEAKTMWNFVAKVRRSLGDFDDGSPVMPAADRTRGHLRLDPRVVTDLTVLREAIDRAATESSATALATLRDALGLIEGPPFDAAGYDWAHRDQDVAEAAAAIQQAVDQLVDLALDAGQPDIAREGITRGLRGLPGDEHLYRTRMRVESTAGNHAGIVAAFDELETYLADLETQPSPVTTALYHELIGSGRPSSGALR